MEIKKYNIEDLGEDQIDPGRYEDTLDFTPDSMLSMLVYSQWMERSGKK